mmetsp:Transcript_46696/g.69441  ORF Transcript_46696/g.69441 Transcript_46696/m.69441 type:complete len:496 (-) Transcript_46696:176-1663(-)|eukprot:CAMPEP_0194048638 /NCGR_PEP_ID=MMETSP0009_2-20130614/27933_1 /TAXON_ID=210454 /ORGANISM="Grammatophora oceanica, Strain CCMP 410" /LENGTH=495 /DNA_ID=CAMNT_0038694565 /DNA_START=789 /DNA_END=2276 /DNA_ORIENTATION=+
MSKWLRRGQNNDTSAANITDNSENFEPPPSNMATAAQATAYAASPGYAGAAMDVDQDAARRNNFQYNSGGGSNKNYDASSSHNRSSRSVRSRQNNDLDPRSSNRSSTRTRTPQHRQGSNGTSGQYAAYQQQPHHQTARGSATNAAPSPYAGQFKSPSPPPEAMQPTYPPPAVTAESPPSSSQQPPQRRPAYLLHRDLVIGKGSYGQVCIASRGEPEGHSAGRSGKRKKFACKCVLLRNDPKYIAKLQEEVNVLRELRGHQNVIRLYDVFCVDNELFIITELGRGGDLFHLLTTHPKHGVTEAYAAKTVVEMLSAVAFLHSRTICHRDLKLENWVLESGKDVWSPLKLIDFGLSTHFSPGQRLSRVVGSSYYVAPEVLKKSYTEACDLWSLGVIVYMLLSGAPPFYGKNDEAIKASIVQGEYTFPHELFRDVSDEAMAFVSTLLSYNTEYRYTAEQALTHPWLAANVDPEALQSAKDGARGVGIVLDNRNAEPMQM